MIKGCHYTSIPFRQLLKDKNLRQSMSRKGNCWDNAPQESFFGHMKDEINISSCNTFSEVKTVIDDYMDYYNTERYQWTLRNYLLMNIISIVLQELSVRKKRHRSLKCICAILFSGINIIM